MANTVNLVTTFLPLVDEKFTTESRKSLLTNNDFDWTGAHSIKVYKVSTSAMNDYDRPGANTATNWSRFGPVAGLDATTEEMIVPSPSPLTSWTRTKQPVSFRPLELWLVSFGKW